MLADFRRGKLQPRYEGLRRGVFDEPNYVRPRFDLLGGRPYNRLTVQTSRGCPLNCEFCAASLRSSSYTSGSSWAGACGSPCPMADRMRVTSLMIAHRRCEDSCQ